MATLERPPSPTQGRATAVQEDWTALRSGIPSLPLELLSYRPVDPRPSAQSSHGLRTTPTVAPPLQANLPFDPTLPEPAAVSEETSMSLRSARTAFLSVLLSLLNPPSLLERPGEDGHVDGGPDDLRNEVDEYVQAAARIAAAHPSTASVVHARLAAAETDSSSITDPARSSSVGRQSATTSKSLHSLLALVDAIASTLPSAADTTLAHSLGSLLECLDRLLALGEPSSPSPRATPLLPNPLPAAASTASRFGSAPAASVGMYDVIQREVQALQGEGGRERERGRARSDSTSVHWQVEAAEAEYLWGKVDDLLDTVGDLCRERTAATRARTMIDDPFGDHWVVGAEDVEPGPSAAVPSEHELPRYSCEGTRSSSQHDLATADPASPPLYGDEKADLAFSPSCILDRHAAMAPQAARTAAMGRPPAVSEKMQRDLDQVTTAIERLYSTAPQLANQRASLTSAARLIDPAVRRAVRERQLDAVLAAIDRMSRSRLDDQRATVPDGVAEGIIGMGWDGGKRSERLKKEREQSLRDLLERLERAASRRLEEQRVEWKPRAGLERSRSLGAESAEDVEGGVLRGRARGQGDEVKGKGRYDACDEQEKQTRDYIVARTGAGRLSAQDASFTRRPSSASTDSQIPSPLGGGDLGLADFLRRSDEDSLPQGAPEVEDSGLRAVATRSKSLSNVAEVRPVKKKFSKSLLFRQSNSGANGNGSGEGSPPRSPLRTGFFGRRTSPSLSKRGTGVGCTASESASDDELVLRDRGRAGPDLTIALPVAVRTDGPPPLIQPRDDHLYLKLCAAGGPAPPPGAFDIVAPFSAGELARLRPRRFACAGCRHPLVAVDHVGTYRALPSEHWRELLDAWMCHQDQGLSEDVADKGRRGFRPGRGEVLVGSSYLLVDGRSSSGWRERPGARARVIEEQVWRPIECGGCQAPLGLQLVDEAATAAGVPHGGGGGGGPIVRLDKVAVAAAAAAPGREHGIGEHVSARLLELAQAHGSYRFLVSVEETEEPVAALWLFNASARVRTTGSGDRHVAKVCFMAVAEHQGTDAWRSFVASPQLECLAWPRGACDRLAAALAESQRLYPPSCRVMMGSFGVAFLDRL